MSSNVAAFIESATADIYTQTAQLNGNGNLLVSPLSLLYATLMVYVGAKGETRKQLETSFRIKAHFRGAEDTWLAEFGRTLPEFKNTSAVEVNPWDPMPMVLESANAAFVENQFNLLNVYLKKVVNQLNAEVFKTFFIKEADVSRQDINGWVDGKTRGKITELIPAGAIDADTKLVLVNALYFKAQWMERFDEALTKEAAFTTQAGHKKSTDFMEIPGKTFPYAEDKELNAQYIELPYHGNASFLIILPKSHNGLRGIEGKLSSAVFSRLRSAVQDKHVQVKLPKFKLEMEVPAKDILLKMGVKDMFQHGAADLTGIADDPSISVSDVFQKTFIEVDEKGTEAAAATAAVVVNRMLMIQPPSKPQATFIADHPFLFAVRYNPTNAIMFIGRVEDV